MYLADINLNLYVFLTTWKTRECKTITCKVIDKDADTCKDADSTFIYDVYNIQGSLGLVPIVSLIIKKTLQRGKQGTVEFISIVAMKLTFLIIRQKKDVFC